MQHIYVDAPSASSVPFPKVLGLSHATLLERLDYDPETGVFRWRTHRKPRLVGQVAGSVKASGYRYIKIDGVFYRANRLAIFHATGEWPSELVDHEDGDCDNNALGNLRDASHGENSQNRVASSRNVCGLLGVTTRPYGRFEARITVDGETHRLGTFGCPMAAHITYAAAKTRHHTFEPRVRRAVQ